VYSPTVGGLGDIDITICEECGGEVKVIASIEDSTVIRQILTHPSVEKSRIHFITRKQGTATKGVTLVADEIKVKFIQLTTLPSQKEAAGNRHVWWQEFDWNDRGIQLDFRCSRTGRLSESLFFILVE
jgi:hypothetical protein